MKVAPVAPRLERAFRALIRARWPIVALYAVLLPVAVALALRVPEDSSIDRLIVATDPDAVRTREFQAIFPETPRVVLVLQSPRIYEPEMLAAVERLEARLRAVPRVSPISALSLYDRARPPSADPEMRARDFRAFANGSKLLRRQGLTGQDWLGIPLSLTVANARERDETLAAIDRVLLETLGADSFDTRVGVSRHLARGAEEKSTAGRTPSLVVRRVGAPYVESWIEGATRASSRRTFPLFGLFVVVLNVLLYRSFRALVAILASLGVAVALTVGFAALAGYSFTILSSLVPLTVLVTGTATLVYVHSRFVDCPEGADPWEHQIFALANKFTPCVASLFAAAVGLAALAVSGIRPVREMGLWSAAGLVMTGLVVFTLFPALQRILGTPTHHERNIAGAWFPHLMDRLPAFSWRWRRPILAGSIALSLAGAAALFGVPGLFSPMRLETDALAYIPSDLPVSRDTRWFEQQVSGLSVVDAWLQAPQGLLLDPEALRGLELFRRRVEAGPDVSSAIGPTTVLSWMRSLAGESEALPGDAASWEKFSGDFEQLVLAHPELREFLDTATLANARLTVIHRAGDYEGVRRLTAAMEAAWRQTAGEIPALSRCSMQVVGQGLLQAKIAGNLVPTLTESFALTAAIIFMTFLLVFRSGAARLLAMIPSLFALLVTFLFMRLTGIPLNVATILIASVVLGASENDQIHFFYHYQEGRGNGGAEESLRHTLRVAGRAILFATLINAGGFLALALSDLPPMRQFGLVASSAFLFSMLADFTVLPASLWIVFRDRPRTGVMGPQGS